MISLYSGLAAAFFSLAAAQSTTTTSGSSSTASLWIPLELTSAGDYAASIVDACSDKTTYTMACASNCIPYAPTVTITAASDNVQVKYQTSTLDVMFSVSESCTVASGSSSASCSVTATASANGNNLGTATQAIYTGAAYTDQLYQIPITSGADKASAHGTCTGAAVSNAAPIIFAAAGAFALGAAIVL